MAIMVDRRIRSGPQGESSWSTQKFPDNTESGWKLGLYAASRASQLRRMRAPRPQVERGAQRSPERRRCARWCSAVSGRASPQWAEAAIAQSLANRAPVRYLATGPVPTTPIRTGRRGSPAHRSRRPRALVDGRNRLTWQRNCGQAGHRAHAGRRPRRLADRGDGPHAGVGRRVRWRADVDDLLDAVGGFRVARWCSSARRWG